MRFSLMNRRRQVFVVAGIVLAVSIISILAVLIPTQFIRVQVQHPASCDCEAEYGLVCGFDGHTYTGACEARCMSGGVVRIGECGSL